MDTRYLEYCFVDRFFYDAPQRAEETGPSYLDGRSVPEGWQTTQQTVWTTVAPKEALLPPQGWKVHVSVCLDNAVAVLDEVWGYCVERGIPFKFLSNRLNLVTRNQKYADRGGSGKFVTIYPRGDEELAGVLENLGDALRGQPGPYILSDARIGSGPLHVRYGGFVRRFCRSATGEPIHAIEAPDGTLVPDVRRPVFETPDWAPIPDVLVPHLAAREADDESQEFPFDITQPLHFSNGGGIYEAVDTRNGQRVVLREARPHAGLDSAGRDAVTRLRRERDVLRVLDGLPCVLRLHDHESYWEHEFLVEEFVEGVTLGKASISRFPLIHPAPTEAEVAEYTTWALGMLDKVERGLRSIHERGVTFGDLHPHNIMVRPDDEICFIDFEAASLPGEDNPVYMGAPGYVPVDGRRGAAADRYALACLRISMFLALNMMLPLDPGKIDGILRAIERRFPVPTGFAATVLAELALPEDEDLPAAAGRRRVAALADRLDADSGAVPDLRASIVRAIRASATPERDDRLFPGDIKQFVGDGLGIAYGTAGVLHSLSVAGFDVAPEHSRWLLDAVRRADMVRPGLYDGMHGIAYVLDELGHRDEALALIERLEGAPLDDLPTTLFDGLAGIGLTLDHFAGATGDPRHRDAALGIADRLAALTGARRSAEDEEGRKAKHGLMYGGSGRAAFFLKLFETTGDQALLDLARAELNHDLDNCLHGEDGTLQVDEGWRRMPYLETGSAGVLLVIQDYLRHRGDSRFEEAIDPIVRAGGTEFVIGSGLFNGRAGLLAVLARLRDRDPGRRGDLDRLVDMHVRRLSWHVLSFHGEAAFPGDQLMRMSMDLATGSAGVLLALDAASGGRAGGFLPLVTRGSAPLDSTLATATV